MDGQERIDSDAERSMGGHPLREHTGPPGVGVAVLEV
jgi:hypothetical protein